ncbi:MAG: hypothetical protein QNJ44_21445 [Rhodobacter sp.]|nr:hypothetical protein [Rhodobacter sp.]
MIRKTRDLYAQNYLRWFFAQEEQLQYFSQILEYLPDAGRKSARFSLTRSHAGFASAPPGAVTESTPAARSPSIGRIPHDITDTRRRFAPEPDPGMGDLKRTLRDLKRD